MFFIKELAIGENKNEKQEAFNVLKRITSNIPIVDYPRHK